ncbi:caspase family protein [Saprospira sp. CCB-QB6]|uniref:caspase family protein n=1 Tax=Saprospira sp. CCB-QB6 TaxID=3023936 RepID=UPI00234983B2|nr:caspase family protein [Saprospira sp. CCB-QB6]WCL81815.1 caspase family protein [Saprospira sp. CCB-QB6]
MKKQILGLFLLMMGAIQLQAQLQCLSGNCDNGIGRARKFLGEMPQGTYEGEFKNGKFDGLGKFSFVKGGFFEGRFKSGLYNGEGVLVDPEGNIKAGRWEDNILVEVNPKIRKASECLEGDCEQGYGKSMDYKGRVYEGYFVNRKYEGKGNLTYTDGSKYEGDWKNGLPDGEGTHYYRNGHKLSGRWVEGRCTENPIKMWAVVVGVANYQDFDKLTYTIDDARKFYSFLRSPEGGALPNEQIKLLLDEEATAKNILNTMGDLYEQADSNDLIIFYFAGHGLEGGFLPVDYQRNGSNTLYHTAVANMLNDSEAKFKLILADACHSGSLMATYAEYRDNGNELPPANNMNMGRDVIAQYKESFKRVDGGLAMILSSASEEISLETKKFEQGVFSYFLIMGLKGYADSDGNYIITVQELFDFIAKNVRKFTYGFQTPKMMGFLSEDYMPKGLNSEEMEEKNKEFVEEMPVGFGSKK